MKVSELTAAYVASWLGFVAEGEELSATDTAQISVALASAKAHAAGFTRLTEAEMDDCEDITIAVLGLCNDYLVNNRPEGAVAIMNKMSEGILSMHCKNFL